jgi:multidrug efflux pump subunit AcrA (membrane-fusion protein)
MMIKRLFLLLFITLFFISCGNNSGTSEYKAGKTVKVTTEIVKKTKVPEYRSFSGSASSKDTTMLVPKVVGYIAKYNFLPGEKFKKGDVLVILKSKELKEKYKFAQNSVREASNGLKQAELGLKMAKSQLGQAESQYVLAEKTYKRFKNLLKTESVSQQEFDQVESQYKAAKEAKMIAESNVELAKQKINQIKIKKQQAISAMSEVKTYLSYTKMKAPYDGIFLEKLSDIGNLAAPGQPIAKIGTLDSIIVTYFNEKLLPYVKIGDSVKVEIDSIGLKYNSYITEISPNIDPATRNFKVKIAGHPNIVEGMYAKVWFEKGFSEKVLIPKSSIIKRGQLYIVFTDKKGVAEMRFIKLGKLIGDKYEVRSGLMDGDKIVTSNVDMIEAGDKLEE